MSIGIKIRDIMVAPVITISPNESILDAANLMNREEIGSLVVIEDKRVVGILTERDILVRVVGENRIPEETLVKEVMTRPVTTIDASASLRDAVKLMVLKRIKKLPVMDGDKLVGIITMTDLIRLYPHVVDILIESLKQTREKRFRKYLPTGEP